MSYHLRQFATLAALVLVAACAGPGSASPTDGPSAAPTAVATDTPPPTATNAPSPPATLLPTATPLPADTPIPTPTSWSRTPSPECVLPPDLVTVVYQTDPVACYGDADLVLVGSLQGAGAVDWVAEVEPAWLAHPSYVLEALLDETGKRLFTLAAMTGPLARTSTPVGPMLFIAIDPSGGVDPSGFVSSTVRATGHFDDPVATTCHVIADYTGGEFGDREAVAACRNTFVVTAIEPF